MFQVQLTIGMISQFILILGYLLLIDIHFSFKLSYILNIMPAFFLLIVLTSKVIFLNNTIEKCCKEAKRTEHALHILRDFTYDPERQEEILQFILQIGQNSLKLSGMGLFNFGHYFAYEYIRTLLDCIIIIEQLNNFSNYSL
ncbi:uncharacterized protein LOC122525949 [Polistes fuscatus]|uniref:uncharacterized protein LOC122525949 n=1 Tax=Polistes fuscatus TaxID=30207 RepID=UPI001CA934E9|nr:uncharacterized protein LOC122525949 [Polistes fuscatus]